jgi:hypothetical protein
LHLFNPLVQRLTRNVLSVPHRSLMLILQVLQLVAELPLRCESLLSLPLYLLVSPLLLPRNQVLKLLRVQLLRRFELFLLRLELGLEIVKGNS